LPDLLHHGHDPGLAALSFLVALLASFTALDLAARIRPAAGRARLGWTAAGAVAMGGGIWAMHFIAMLALRLPVPVAYDPGLTALSLLVAVLFTGAGLALAAAGAGPPAAPRLAAAGALMGGGVAAMHYTGMAAMALPAAPAYDPGLVALSVAVAVAAATAALRLALTLEGAWPRAAAAPVMATAVCGMHYTGMAALTLRPLPGAAAAAAGAPPALLAAGVAAAACAILCLGLLTAFADRRLAAAAAREAAALRESEERFRTIAEALPIPIALTSLEGGDRRVLFSNGRSRRLFRVPEADAMRRPVGELYEDQADRQRLAEAIRRDGAVDGFEVRMRRYDGSAFWALVSARVTSFHGRRLLLSGYYDITDRKAAEAALRASEERYALVARGARDGLWDWDLATGAVYYAPRWCEMAGLDPAAAPPVPGTWLDRVHPEDLPALRAALDAHLAGATPRLEAEYRMRGPDGAERWMLCRGLAVRGPDGRAARMAGSQSDITRRKSYELKLIEAAYHDAATGLKNRAWFVEQLAAGGAGALAVVNLDRFARVNAGLGHAAGNAVLAAAAARLEALLAPGDRLARLGGDEFALFRPHAGPGGPAPDAAAAWADGLVAALRRPLPAEAGEIAVTASAGLALGEAGEALLRDARLALDRARAAGRDRAALFDAGARAAAERRLRLERELPAALEGPQFHLHYQPIHDLAGGGVVGFEALARWRHPELGAVPPAEFVPIAEEGGAVLALGRRVLREALAQLAAWGRPDMSVAVNLSPRQLMDRRAMAELLALVDAAAPAPGQLKLEVTESLLIHEPEAVGAAIAALRARGVAVSLDDFGTGYSSLSYLHRFAFDVLKIDRSFVSRMATDEGSRRLVRTIVELGRDLGLTVVAEGVETAAEAEALRLLGCHQAQGFHFARPLPPEAAEALLPPPEAAGALLPPPEAARPSAPRGAVARS